MTLETTPTEFVEAKDSADRKRPMNDTSAAVSEIISVEYTEHVAVMTMVHRPYNLIARCSTPSRRP